MGTLWAGFSDVASRHPNAWTRDPVSPERIVTPADDNRPICFPYTKRMVSLVSADLGAAVLLTTERRAASLRGGNSSPIYFLGGGYSKDRQRFMVDKADYTRSPSLASAAAKAQARAKRRVDEVEGFDLYSCFPCAVQVARRELGIGEDDTRALTQTGGLGFFGGPGSNYALHGIASLAENIAEGRLRSGMATALGWFMHKYAAGLYADRPSGSDLAVGDREDDRDPEAGNPPVPRAESVDGEGTLETYTVIYARDHRPVRGLLYGRTDEGVRFVANSAERDEVFAELTTENCVGRRLRLSSDRDSGCNRAEILAS